MRNLMMWIMLSSLMALGIMLPTTASARETVVPFITAEHYMKNIALDEYRTNQRGYFRSEAAFDLLVDYVADEIGQPLTDAQFIALMRSDQVRARDCPTSEVINTGALRGNQFYWFTRHCRLGEQIVQAKVHGRWIDLFSLNCLNAVEDKTPVPSPLVFVPAPPEPQPKQCRWVAVSQTVRQNLPYQLPSTAIHVGCCKSCSHTHFINGQLVDFGTSGSITYEQVCD